MFYFYMIKSNATKRAIVVMLSAKQLPTGRTKLSGSKPLLNVSIEIAYDKMAMALKAIMLEIKSVSSRLEIPCKENMSFKAKDKKPRTVNKTSDAVQALKMFLA